MLVGVSHPDQFFHPDLFPSYLRSPIMKFLLRYFTFLFFLLIFSCGNDSGNSSERKDTTETVSHIPDAEKTQLLQIIRGGWLNEEYIFSLEKYHSPMDAAPSGLPVQQMAFDISDLKGDTLINFGGRYFYHEGECFEVIFYRKADGKTGMKINENRNYISKPLELDYEISETDTILLLTISGNENKTLRFRRVFAEFKEKDELFLPAIELYINRNYFAGEWKNGNQTMQLTEYGQVRNFKNYKRYSVSYTDAYPQSRPDEITFYNDTAGTTFAYSLKEGNLKLYELFESNDGTVMERGRLVYVFKK